MDEQERREEEEDGADRRQETPADINPWRDIFFRPRATTRWLLANETAGSALMLWLSFTALFIVALFLTVMFFPGSLGERVTKIQLVVFTPVIFLFSWVYFVVESYLLCVLSRLIGGRCEVWEMRVVNAFTTVIPGVVLGLARLGVLFVVGREGLAAKLVDNAILVWTVYITLCGVAAAAGINAWRALAVCLASIGLWLAAALAVNHLARTLTGL
jgi:hypothetical protein